MAYTSALDLLELYRSGEASPVEVTEQTLDRIERLNPSLHCFLTVTGDRARAAAADAERRYAEARACGDLDALPPLLGVPLSLKDLVDVEGVRTTFGSKLYENNVAQRDAILWQRLDSAGAVLLGKTNTSEFGMAAFTSNELGDSCGNPFDPGRIAGGSSGGAGSAVAAGLGPIAHGTDGGGSVRIPAAYNGVVGFKPTGRRIPKFDWAAGMSQISTDGPLTRTVRDAALALQVMAGPDPRDPQALPDPPDDYLAACDATDLADLRLAWSPDLGGHAVAGAAVLANARRAVAALGERAGSLEEAAPTIDEPLRVYGPISSAGAAANYAEAVAGSESDLTDYARSNIERGAALSGPDVARAYANVDRFRARMRVFFDDYDILLTPTLARGAYPHGEIIREIEGQPINAFAVSILYTTAFSLTQQPAASVPTGFDDDGMPTAIQIVGRHGADATVFRVAAALEEALPWAGEKPPLEGTG
jgi:Asp-tRNA(Asn)/Glu-tRNA(Gln) amidotransferase A subunit family amidase